METRKRSTAMTKICKKHPTHRQSPGVCSFCLRERLSKISSSSSRAITNVSVSSSLSSVSSISSVSSSHHSSNAPSYKESPMHNYRDRGNIHNLEGKGYFSFLKKSRSMASVSEKIIENDGKIKKKDGFWSKLMGSKYYTKKRSNGEGSSRFMHSRTMKEMLTTRRV